MKNGPGGQTDLRTTALAVKNISRSNEPSLAMTTLRTFKSIGPSNFSQMINACFLRGKGLLKIDQTSFPILFRHAVYHGF